MDFKIDKKKQHRLLYLNDPDPEDSICAAADFLEELVNGPIHPGRLSD
jgi:hypothetical protein